MSPIKRCHHGRDDPFTKVSNRLLDDMALDLEAKGLLAYFLRHDDKWCFRPDVLAKKLGISRAKVCRIIKRLMDAHYVTRVWVQVKNDAGKYTSATAYTVFEDKAIGKLYEDKIPF